MKRGKGRGESTFQTRSRWIKKKSESCTNRKKNNINTSWTWRYIKQEGRQLQIGADVKNCQENIITNWVDVFTFHTSTLVILLTFQKFLAIHIYTYLTLKRISIKMWPESSLKEARWNPWLAGLLLEHLHWDNTVLRPQLQLWGCFAFMHLITSIITERSWLSCGWSLHSRILRLVKSMEQNLLHQYSLPCLIEFSSI